MEKNNKNFKDFTGLYELSKTLRFGFSQHQNNSDIGKNRTHHEFSDLVKNSFERVEKDKKEKIEGLKEEKDFISDISDYIEKNKEQLKHWGEISKRTDLIKFSKEYLKVLSRKAKFDFSKKISLNFNGMLNNKKQPSNIQKNIARYFQETVEKNQNLIEIFEPSLEQFKEYLKDKSKSHLKPNLIDFRKQFLSVLRVSGEWLNPLKNAGIEIVIKNTDKEENEIAINFVSKENRRNQSKMHKIGEEVKAYFEANGKQVPFAKCTLNYYTARQKPENVETKIIKLIEILRIKELYCKVGSLNKGEIEECVREQNFLDELDGENKLEKFSNYSEYKNALTQIEWAQVFKPKPIPASVKYRLIDRLVEKEKYNREKLEILFESIGEGVDISADFKDLQEEKKLENFSLENYPLKLAFDYAWEKLAKNLSGQITDDQFAKEQCAEFLREFGIDYENYPDLKLYSYLSFIRDELATLEHNNPRDKSSIIWNIKTSFNNISVDLKNKGQDYQGDAQNILSYINGRENDFFQNSKQNLGLLRGGLKNKVRKYYNFTQNFKEIAGFLGRNFVDLRDKLREEYQFNKISHYAVLLEDKENTYLLALEIDVKNELKEQERNDRLDILENCLMENKQNNDNILVKKVSSFTSKTLNKIMKNGGGYQDFYFNEKVSGYYYDRNKYLQILKKENSAVVDYVKKCLTQSKMSKDQNWNEKFDWDKDLKNCKTYEEIEKVLDIKGYCLEEKFISKKQIKVLVEEKNCLLFPILNQDISSQANQDKFISHKNQFTKDFEEATAAARKDEDFRIHPECTLFYKFPLIKPQNETEEDLKNGHKAKILNRNMRFQIIGNFGIEKKAKISEIANFISRKEKLKIIRDKDLYKKEVENFNKAINTEAQNGDREYFYGIDRGIKELATLCVLDKQKKIQDFILFKKEKSKEKVLSRLAETGLKEKEVYRYKSFKKQSVLDLTNIKIETWHIADEKHPNSKFLKDAFEEIEQDKELKEIAEKMGHNFNMGNKSYTILVEYPEKRGSMAVKLRINHYQRLLAYSLSHSEKREMMKNIAEEVFAGIKSYADIFEKNKENIVKKLFGLKDDFTDDVDVPSIFKELQATKLKLTTISKHNFTLLFDPLLQQFFEWFQNKDAPNYEEEFKKKYEELGDLDNLKKGIVANMVGVINFLMKTRKGMVVLEDVEITQKGNAIHGLQGNSEETHSHGYAEHIRYAGTETYRYLEKMLVRKFTKEGLTPPFADLDSLNKVDLKINGKDQKNKKQFGVFYYVPAQHTSNICPKCGFCICEKDDQYLLPFFAKPQTKEEIKEKCIKIFFDSKDNKLILNLKDGKKLEIKHFNHIKENEQDNIKRSKKINSKIISLLTPRLGSRSEMYKWNSIKHDPVFCSVCGFNTEEAEILKSGDDVGAYNIAKSGLEVFNK